MGELLTDVALDLPVGLSYGSVEGHSTLKARALHLDAGQFWVVATVATNLFQIGNSKVNRPITVFVFLVPFQSSLLEEELIVAKVQLDVGDAHRQLFSFLKSIF